MNKEEMKNSVTHPIRLDFIDTKLPGKIGITFCPGKYQKNALSGCWNRDLDLDLQYISKYDSRNISTIVTLIQKYEFEQLNVENLPLKIRQYGFNWLHLALTDGSIPDHEWIDEWNKNKYRLIDSLNQNEDIIIHCKGGLGRAGTVSAILLKEIGYNIEEAIQKVRQCRGNYAIESNQEEWLKEHYK